MYNKQILLQLYNRSKALESYYTKTLYQDTMAIKWKTNEEKYVVCQRTDENQWCKISFYTLKNT